MLINFNQNTFLSFKNYRNELADEKTKHRETKRTSDDKSRQSQQEVRDAKMVTDDKKKMCSELEDKITDLDDKWSKSKRINKQKQDKIDSLEKELESSKTSGKDDCIFWFDSLHYFCLSTYVLTR